MSFLKNRIRNLQEKPYRTRVRILWATVIVTAILLLIVWLVSLQLRKPTGESNSGLTKIWESIKTVKDIRF